MLVLCVKSLKVKGEEKVSKKLLLADDSVTIQKVVNLTFADEGIEVLTASDGNTAIEMLKIYRPDIVIADVNMPGLNGYQLCERIKKDERLKSIPVVLLVGSFEPFDEQEAKRVGADDFLTKPFQSIRQLINKVSALLESSVANGQEWQQVSEEVEFTSIAEDDTIKAEHPSDIISTQTTYEEKTEKDLAVTTPLSMEEIGRVEINDTSQKEVLASDLSSQTHVSEEKEHLETADDQELETSNQGFKTSIEEKSEKMELSKLPVTEHTSEEKEPLLSEQIPSPERISLLESSDDEILELPSLPEEKVSRGTQASQETETLASISSSSQVVVLPPEVIDAIAQKVVEKFAEKTIKEIAWEVVPQQAELIIRKIVEERLKQK